MSENTKSSVLDRLENAGNGGKIIVIPTTVTSLEEYRQLDNRALGSKLAIATRQHDTHTLENGKMVVVLRERQPESVKTLKKWIKRCVGMELQTEVYKVANAFRLVSAQEPEEGGKFYGSITEAQFDAAPLRWMMIASSILNKLDKDYAQDAAITEKARETACEVFRHLPKSGAEKLRAILKSLAAEEEETEEPEVITPFTAESVAVLAKHIKARLEVTEDPVALRACKAAFQACSDLSEPEEQPASAQHQVRQMTPEEKEAAKSKRAERRAAKRQAQKDAQQKQAQQEAPAAESPSLPPLNAEDLQAKLA